MRVRWPAELELRAIFVLLLRALTISPGAERVLSPLPARYSHSEGSLKEPRAAIGARMSGAESVDAHSLASPPLVV